MSDLEFAAKRERELIAAEEKAERRVLKAQAKHRDDLKDLDRTQRKAAESAEELRQAEELLRAAQADRAAGPV